MEIETIQSPLSSHSVPSSHGDSHIEGLYPSPPPSPTTRDQSVYLTSAPDSSTSGTPLRQENVYHSPIMSPPYTPLNQSRITDQESYAMVPVTRPTGTVEAHTCPSSQLIQCQLTSGASIYSSPIPSSAHSDDASMIGTGAITESFDLEKAYSKDDVDVIIELTKFIQANPQKFCEMAKSLIPGESEMLTTVVSNGQVLKVHQILKEKFEHWGKQLNLRRLNRFFTFKCEEQMFTTHNH